LQLPPASAHARCSLVVAVQRTLQLQGKKLLYLQLLHTNRFHVELEH
jgi:hypothetical protein